MSTSADRAPSGRLYLSEPYRGGIEGAFGPGTYNAVTAYARDQGVSMSTTAKAYGAYDGMIY